ncbi:lipopolysaccharide kinase InaA family protein [Salegentibacter sp. JZCK2]|uniref:lipopolysaccharide kinase InaA family protein n=1 Tax=Salegentibacter tibetensis TaxID=2873600 RepID=UPI001CCF5F44|nr:lipopolysaccharide kinase InaA family protein [Salegentibacter tibetensis]MBZ9729462.1 lipopolysaccharide kinase InaA family protein [Salegentibacter tibetensis]
MKLYISKYHKLSKKSIAEILLNFNAVGQSLFGDDKGRRNRIKVVEKDGKKFNIKSFKQPNYINRYVYVFLRKSKAERSFEFAEKLTNKDIGTPKPIAYAEETSKGALTKSFYISEHLDCDLTFRDLDLTKPGHEDILRAFTRFTYDLHQKKIEFLDHSPGNTLIQLNNGDYRFYLVDLNRMVFKSLNFTERMKNFARLTSDKEKVKIMAEEYAELLGKTENEVFNKMWFFTRSFFENRGKKRKMKLKLKKLVGIN